MSEATTRGHPLARRRFHRHQICDIVDVIEERSAPLRLFRADGGATSSALVVQTQADLLGREDEVAEVAEVSALGAAKLAWRALGNGRCLANSQQRSDLSPNPGPDRTRRRRDVGLAKSVGPVSLRAPRATDARRDRTAVAEVEIAFIGPDAANPYTDVDAWVIFSHDSGRQLRRPVFWDGGTTYRVRFASTQPEGEWRWSIHTARPHHDFKPAHGTLIAGPPIQDHPHRAVARGFATAHPSGRSFCYADGSPAFWVFDTAWAMFRATVEDVVVYSGPPSEGLQRRASDECSAGHERADQSAAMSMRASRSAFMICQKAASPRSTSSISSISTRSSMS